MIPLLFVVVAVGAALLAGRAVRWWVAGLFFLLGFLTADTAASGPVSQVISTVLGVVS
ncbi:hypothetical protein [Streptomyces sp. NPDC002599]|uniref:hypothetical protein n=1 Tax=Streptomyces sp. NPDC002599 TaxID=3154421 RepID=UPI00332CEB04